MRKPKNAVESASHSQDFCEISKNVIICNFVFETSGLQIKLEFLFLKTQAY